LHYSLTACVNILLPVALVRLIVLEEGLIYDIQTA